MASLEVTLLMRAMNGFIETVIKKLVLDIVANLQADPQSGGTPRDTSWAAVNWVPSIGSPIDTTAGTRLQAEAGSLSTASEAATALVAATYKLAMGNVYITNNVPYILTLDGGSSKQAAKGFVGRGIVKAIRVDLVAG